MTGRRNHGRLSALNGVVHQGTYSMDLRERALLDSDAGMKAADVAVKYRVSGSWVRLLKQRRRETGEVAPRVPAARAAPGCLSPTCTPWPR